MTYTELLQQKEWKEKCNAILQRDRFTCQDCGRTGFHNGSYIPINSLKEVDMLLGNTIFEGQYISEIINGLDSNIEDNHVFKCQPVKKTANYKNVFDYLVSLWDEGDNEHDDCFTDIFNYQEASFITKQDIESVQLHGYLFGNKTFACGITVIRFDNIDVDNILRIEYSEGYLNFNISMANVMYLFPLYSKDFSVHNHINRLELIPGLNIHHQYYVDRLKPWEYENTALVTLCEDCHQKRHENSVPCYRSLELKDISCSYFKCDRCGGSGYLPQYYYVEHGICFKCGGEGVAVER